MTTPPSRSLAGRGDWKHRAAGEVGPWLAFLAVCAAVSWYAYPSSTRNLTLPGLARGAWRDPAGGPQVLMIMMRDGAGSLEVVRYGLSDGELSPRAAARTGDVLVVVVQDRSAAFGLVAPWLWRERWETRSVQPFAPGSPWSSSELERAGLEAARWKGENTPAWTAGPGLDDDEWIFTPAGPGAGKKPMVRVAWKPLIHDLLALTALAGLLSTARFWLRLLGAWRWRRWRRLGSGRCGACGYEAGRGAAACPECGAGLGVSGRAARIIQGA